MSIGTILSRYDALATPPALGLNPLADHPAIVIIVTPTAAPLRNAAKTR